MNILEVIVTNYPKTISTGTTPIASTVHDFGVNGEARLFPST